MLNYIIRRLLYMIPVVLGVLILVFMIVHLSPGDPAQLIAGSQAPPEVVEQVREKLGLNQPLYLQFFNYLARLLRGDLGKSYISYRPVASEIKRVFWNTVELVIVAQIWSMLLAIPIGVISGVKRKSLIDMLTRPLAIMGISFPLFFVGLVLLYYTGFKLHWFPLGGRGGPLWTLKGLHYIILPAITIGIYNLASLVRLTRSTILEVLNQDYIRTARAKGLREKMVIYKHALRNSLLPVTTVIGLQIGMLLGGAVVTETIFSWPGMGRMMVNAIMTHDFPLVQGTVLILALIFVVVNLLVDILYGALDPRIRYN